MLTEIIKNKIKEEGPIPFRDFMDMALYYPGLGYYTSTGDKIGMKGDYYTSCDLTPAFGAAIATQLQEMWTFCGEQEFTIVEYGAGTGSLCHDILDHLSANKNFYEKLSYCIIEKSPFMREKAKKHLPDKVRWHDSLKEIGEFTGCVLSNELLDNFPVHRVVMRDELMEIFVDHENDFKEMMKPAQTELKNYLEELQVTLPKGFQTEINLAANYWIKEIAIYLKKGYVLTIDYGYPSTELYRTHRSCGTLMCYNKHTTNGDLYSNIGSQDITSHVNFSALSHWGKKSGLNACGFTDQASFLLNLGFKEHLRKYQSEVKDIISAARREAFLTQTLLLDMGSKFKVLIQQKDMPVAKLSGLKTI